LKIIFLLKIYIYPRRRAAALLLLPYGVWVTTAGFLNHSTISLNGPFG
jgi:tryptophan-rich sensory protein